MPAAERRLRWSPEAESDLREIWRYYAREASAEVADGILLELRTAGDRAADRPLLQRLRERLGAGLRVMLVRPYLLFYRLNDTDVEIVRVLHERRDIEAAFSDRMKER